CGPTVYNYPHIGNMRAYVFADVLGRTLSFKGYKLTHVINITDVGHLTDDADAGEDKMEKMAAAQAQSIWDIAEHYKQAYWADVRALNIRQPAAWTVATDYVPQMIEFAKGIADRHCYELDSGLYFDVSTVADYGRLARANAETLADEGEGRIEAVEGKRNAADFAIWRKTPPGEKRQMEWDSPWGKGAPGWHLECSVMSGEVLGFPFDIHTGGIDHREIHHPNEIAQNQAHCCTNGLDVAANSGAKVWMHNNFLVERSGKMSKSSGEFLRLQLLIDKGYHPLAYRMMCLQAHYRSELEFSWEGLGAALVRLKRIVRSIPEIASRTDDGKSIEDHVGDLEMRFDAAISDDLNTPKALTMMEEEVSRFKGVGPNWKRQIIERMDSVLGLNLLELKLEDLRIPPKSATITEAEIEAILAARKEARAAKDFAISDRLRDELAAQGVEVMDGDPLRWDWKLG
ncbi:MAG: cysteine--tRNA ligase, partial [Sphingomonadales bacterium]|nr:cysteine--tRNA ligase [Sphingomonadales bacterium]